MTNSGIQLKLSTCEGVELQSALEWLPSSFTIVELLNDGSYGQLVQSNGFLLRWLTTIKSVTNSGIHLKLPTCKGVQLHSALEWLSFYVSWAFHLTAIIGNWYNQMDSISFIIDFYDFYPLDIRNVPLLLFIIALIISSPAKRTFRNRIPISWPQNPGFLPQESTQI